MKNSKVKVNSECIEVLKLRMKKISNNTRENVFIKLKEIKKVQIFNDHIEVATNSQFYNVIPKDDYKVLTDMLSENEVENVIEKSRIQYIMYSYAETVASMKKIIMYADENEILMINTRSTKNIVGSLSSNRLAHKNNNVIDFQMEHKDK